MKSINWNLRIGTIITGVMVLFIIVGIFWTPCDPNKVTAELKQPPSSGHILGTDNFGRDIFSRILLGARTTFLIAAATVAIGVVFGVLIGGFTGYFGGVLDDAFMRLNDSITAFPSILLALVIISFIGPGSVNVITALGLLFIPSFARIVRAEFARERVLDYVHAAKLMGAGKLRIMFVHILPNTAQVILSATAIGFNNAVLAEASMSFLGIGVQPPEASLGRMLYESQSYLGSMPWYTLSVGVAIILLVLGFALLSEGLAPSDGA